MLRLAVLPAVLAAAWGPPHVIARDGEPKAAVERADGSLTVLADTGAATTFTWPAGATAPLRAAVAPVTTGDPWIVNARGDALLVDTYPPRALAVDVGGTRAELSIPEQGGRAVERIAADLGEDGTAAIAWTERLPGAAATDAVVYVRIRPPGGQFGWVVQVPTGGEARDMDLRVRPDGLVELLHMFWDGGSAHHFLLTRMRAEAATAPESTFVTTTDLVSPVFPVLGSGRALFGFSPVVSLYQTGPGTWSPAQGIPAETLLDRSSLRSLPDGTAVFAYTWRHGIFVARAAPGKPFGAGVRVARGTRGWNVGSPSIASSRAGDLLVSWEETPADPLGHCGFECFARVHAVVAPAGGAFGAPALVSPVGNVAAGEVAAIGAGGERLVAWSRSGISRSGPLLVVRGTPRAARAPRVPRSFEAKVTTTRRALTAAAAGRPLRVGVRCNQACGVALTIHTLNDPEAFGVTEVRPVVLERAGSRTVGLRLTDDDRRELRKALRAGRVRIPIVAENRAGRLVYDHAAL